MATIGLLTELATQQGYGVPLDPSTGLVAEAVPLLNGQQKMFTDADYLGQFIQDTNTNEYFLINRGTATLSNLFATNTGIALGTLNLGFNSDQIGAAKAYGTQVFGELAQKLVRGDPVGPIYLDGHSSGYSQCIAQYEALETLIQTEPAPGEFNFRPYYEQIKSRIRIFGVNGAGAPNSTLPAGSLDSIATNLIVPGDIVDNAGQQYGIQITLDGAGNGYESFGLGALLGVAAKATPLGVALSAVAGGIAGAHSGSNAWEFMQKFPALAAIDDTNFSGYSYADRKALVAVDAYSWQAMSDLDKSALLKHPEAVVQDLFVNGLTPSSIQMESQGGIRYTFNNGVSYLYQNTGGVKTYAFSQPSGDSVTVRVDSTSTAYTFADSSSSIVYNNGDSLFQMPDGSTLYQLADGRGQLQVNGTQYEFSASDQIRLNDQGQWQITSPTEQGAQVVLINNDGTQKPPFIYDAAAQDANSLTLTQTVATGTITTIYQAGVTTQTVDTTLNGNTLNVTYTYDAVTGEPIPHVNSINGKPPTDQAAADAALRQSGVGPGQLVNGDAGVSGTSVGGVVSTYDSAHPSGLQTLTAAVTTTLDALALIKAIQTGQPLPIVASGLRLVNDITSTWVTNANGSIQQVPGSYNLNGAANVASGVLSLMSLDAALKRGDTMGAITAGAQTISFGASAYASFGGTFSSTTASSINSINNALPAISLVNSIAHGDAMGTAVAIADMALINAGMYSVPYIGWAYAAYTMIGSLFGGNDAPPEAWGSAHAQWTGFNTTTGAAGAYGGLESATQTYNGVLSYLDQLVAQEQAVNPGAAIGIVANRLPSLSYRNYTGYSITDIDPLTGEQRNPGTLYDLTGRPYNAPAGSVQASQSLSERMIRVALERGAVAPLWEVQTAALQTQAGDPMAGLTEEERAGRAGLLAPQPAAGATSQMFRAVALDLNGDGVQTTGAARTVAFDVDDSGYLKNTAWLSNNDGFLFLDRNLNGQIDAGSELFSNATVALSERGLNGMRWIDSNYDGSLSPLDPVWNELKVWQDANGNGTAEAGETRTLAQLGITSLNYAMGTFERNGQLSQLASPDLAADTEGTRTHVVPEGIIIQTSNGHTSLLATRIDDKSAIEANRDGVTGYEDTELIISAADLLANDTLAGLSGNNLSITGVSGFTHGSGFLDGNGFVHYTPDANYFGAANDSEWFCERRAA
jgi:hypothetical protein